MEPAPSFWTRLVADMRDWCVGRNAWVRLPVLLYLAYVGFRYLVQPLNPPPHDVYVSWFDGINFGFHELGHIVFRPFGRFLHIFGGTLLQCLMPLIAAYCFLRWRDYFGVAFCFSWMSTSLSGVAIYMADAQLRQLPLVAPGLGRVDASFHDWWNLLSMMDLLDSTTFLASLTKVFALVWMLIGLGFGGWLCWTMIQSPGRVRFE